MNSLQRIGVSTCADVADPLQMAVELMNRFYEHSRVPITN